jgi:hypothetical protein
MIDNILDSSVIVVYTPSVIERPIYMEAFLRQMSTPLVKVLAGIRRCGKSSLLSLLEGKLLADGVPKSRILSVNMESLQFDEYRNFRSMYALVQEKLPTGGYFLLDEAQHVEGWERVAASLLAEGSVECIITGSNASLLKSELGTLLTGRYSLMPVFTLSFPEFRSFTAASLGDQAPPKDAVLLARYLQVGGFPAIHRLPEEGATFAYLSTLLDSILLRDVVQRHAIRDPDGLRRILAFTMDNVGNVTAARRISEYLKSQRRSVSTDTVANYLGYLCDSFLLHRAPRFDIRGKQHLEYSEKYYAGDLGLRHGLLGFRDRDISGVLENAVFLELERRGYTVSVGVVGTREVDFVAERSDERRYYQVCSSLADEATIERELGSLERIDDHWPKAVLVYADSVFAGRSGIKVSSVLDFLNGAE